MKRILAIVVALLTWIAFASVAAATGIYGYQPEIPKTLKK